MVHFGEFFKNLKLAGKQSYQTGQFFIGQKLVENAKSDNFAIFKGIKVSKCQNQKMR